MGNTGNSLPLEEAIRAACEEITDLRISFPRRSSQYVGILESSALTAAYNKEDGDNKQIFEYLRITKHIRIKEDCPPEEFPKAEIVFGLTYDFFNNPELTITISSISICMAHLTEKGFDEDLQRFAVMGRSAREFAQKYNGISREKITSDLLKEFASDYLSIVQNAGM